MVAFVVLHYLAYDMTVACVNTLLQNFGTSDIHIAIVDNASPNGSGKKLQDAYSSVPQVSIIINRHNLGFAKGNNTGYDYCKRFNPNFIVVINNDVLIKDHLFLEKIQNEYNTHRFAVLGPDIYNPKTNMHQNPLYKNGNTKENVIRMRNSLQKGLKHFALYYRMQKVIGSLKKSIKRLLFKKRLQESLIDRSVMHINPVLQGACYIFSKDFISAREYAFYPGTFLYFEEDILHLQCQKQNLKMVYSPALSVEHLEDVATNMILKTDIAKEKMKSENLIHSMAEFITLCDV